jgi:hypothetical protein
MLSQNVTFAGLVADDSEFDHPPGMALAHQLHAALAKRSWTVGEIDNWRDTGWEIPCERNDARLVVVIMAADSESWVGQIHPTDVPGLIGRALGHRPSATDADVFALAVDVHAILVEGGFQQTRWSWDSLREDGDVGPPPAPPIPRAVKRR